MHSDTLAVHSRHGYIPTELGVANKGYIKHLKAFISVGPRDSNEDTPYEVPDNARHPSLPLSTMLSMAHSNYPMIGLLRSRISDTSTGVFVIINWFVRDH